MAFEFLYPIYPAIFIVGGIAGILMGFNRAMKSEEEESDKFKLFAGLSALILFALMILIVFDGGDPTNYSVMFSLLFFMAIIARPLKKVPFAFLIAIIVGLGLFYLAMTRAGDFQVGNLSLKVVAIAIVAFVILIFIIGFFQEQVMDGFLVFLGWGPIIFLLSIAMIAQGITLYLEYPTVDGILGLLPG